MSALSADLYHGPADNTAAVVTLPAKPGGNTITQIIWSYDETPTAGSLTVTDGGTTALKIDITAAGPGFLDFNGGVLGDNNAAVVVTLAAGGGTCAGKLTVQIAT